MGFVAGLSRHAAQVGQVKVEDPEFRGGGRVSRGTLEVPAAQGRFPLARGAWGAA